jgi:hypothetical protein
VRERRRGPMGAAATVAENMAAAMRRLQRDREPHVLVYDESGYARLMAPESRGHARVLELSDEMVGLVAEADE